MFNIKFNLILIQITPLFYKSLLHLISHLILNILTEAAAIKLIWSL